MTGDLADELLSRMREITELLDPLGWDEAAVQQAVSEEVGNPIEKGAGLLPDTARYRFELTLVGEGKNLRIARASWRPVERQQ